ncbi:hypothetical protein SLH49_22155 [Cognatiyoonia sp. IB215446]|uniref:hypothetical protein n=1 Tax=Cognatiyoonia sp. IB215446 TaxID=3097355 RepID=UPI002A1153E7|nr:hypothetical protein [Cognatiyoonia sp. IB215446]MDX8350702.1 hypothetical protein [Cognatiyoonia sp. IB215446]
MRRIDTSLRPKVETTIPQRLSLAIVFFFGFLPMAALARDADATMIINRSDVSIDVFVRIPGGIVVPLTGYLPDFPSDDGGMLDIRSFRADTASLGDQAFAPISFTIDATPAHAEAMGMMVHPITDAIPFTTPWDALTAVTLCSFDDVPQLFQISDLHMYAGHSIYPTNGYGDLRIKLPETGRDDIRFHVLTFSGGELVSQGVHVVADGGTLLNSGIAKRNEPVGRSFALLNMLLVAAVLGAVVLRAALRDLRSPLFET